ncbi:imelysin family protein [Aliiroseovarius sp. S253]|uniref:imelysin family protein n=1 Tax=Aliiroseovarius sp. S253 TaxID=3415133 RepID=UPI003C79C5A6
MRLFAFVATCLLPAQILSAQVAPTADHADISDRVLTVIESQFSAFRNESATLAQTAVDFCDGGAREPVIDALEATWLAWAPLDAYQFGPIEQQAAALTVNFFPDKKNFTGRALHQHLKRPEAEQDDPAIVASSSAALQGLPAIERLLFEDLPTCPSLVGVTGNLAHMAQNLYDGWFAANGWADLARGAGPDNPVYLADTEFTKQIYTAIDFSILRLKEHRLARPLGTYERAFPKRAEAWRSGLTNQIMISQLEGIIALVDQGFADAVSKPARVEALKTLEELRTRIDSIGAPLAVAVEDPLMRVRIEGIMSKLDYLQTQMDEDLGRDLSVQSGFSAGDGD